MNTENTILELEQSCESLMSAIHEQDWKRVEKLDKERLNLIINLANIKQDSLTDELEYSINRILELDKEIQKNIISAWKKAKNELLSLQQARPGIEMYNQKSVN